MPTKQLCDDVPLTPALTFFLMVGSESKERLPGWVTLTQTVMSPEFGPFIHAARDQHAEALIAEATEARFTPWFATRKRPRGPAFEKWRARFEQQHSY